MSLNSPFGVFLLGIAINNPFWLSITLMSCTTNSLSNVTEATAFIFEDQKLSYKELNRRANQIAHYLQTLGVGPEVVVGLCMERSLEMVVGLLGILKAGGAYLPLDPAYPKERLAFMFEDTQVPVLLTKKQFVEILPKDGAQVVCLDLDDKVIARQSEENPVSDVTTA